MQCVCDVQTHQRRQYPKLSLCISGPSFSCPPLSSLSVDCENAPVCLHNNLPAYPSLLLPLSRVSCLCVRPRSAVCLSFPSGVPLSIALHPCLNLLLLLSPALPRHTPQCKTSSQGGVRGRLKTHCVLQVDKPLRGLGSPEE